ncbi:fasciclin domain-containing protein [Aquimarina rubra]|uniref:Fasciclin domain-containing protein n=1 Tax=Aquimarina rubra TaxID=1920033 RepID=A0ABW5LMQ0_9FLAO
MKNLFKKAFLALCIISIAACSDDDDTTFIPPTTTIADLVADNAEYSSLLAALERTDLDVTLNGTGTFTVFAPDNDAFADFLDGTPLNDVPVATLEQILLNHVLGTTVTSGQLTTGYVNNLATESSTSANLSMYINTSNGVVINGVSTVVQADVAASNGIIHFVDEVIPLPTMLTFVAADSDLSSLATTATTTSGFDTDFAAVLSGADSNLTLLAPDNDAFAALGDISGLSAADLEQILLNHVIGGINISTGLATGYGNTLATYGDTMNNLSIYINTDGGVSFNGISNVSTADIVASNGVIHKVDAVITLPTVVTFAIADATFSTLVAALTTLTPSTDFAGILSTALGTDPAPFTVFAPTDDAFAAITVPTDENDIAAILNYHVVGGANVRSTDLTDGAVTTLNGDVTIDASAPSVTGAGNTSASNIIVVDVQAANGVIHAIDQVLLPAAN